MLKMFLILGNVYDMLQQLVFVSLCDVYLSLLNSFFATSVIITLICDNNTCKLKRK